MRLIITLAVILTALWSSRCSSGERPTPPRGFHYEAIVQSHPPATGLHYHKCPKCGDRWLSGIDANESVAAHTCHRCRSVVWEIDNETPAGAADSTPVHPSGAADSHPRSRTEPVSKTTAVCQCGGSNRGVCYCLKSGVTCKCSPGVGSVWNLDATGKPLGKTGQYQNPKTAASKPTEITQALPVAAQLKASAGHWERRCNGRKCWLEWVPE